MNVREDNSIDQIQAFRKSKIYYRCQCSAYHIYSIPMKQGPNKHYSRIKLQKVSNRAIFLKKFG